MRVPQLLLTLGLAAIVAGCDSEVASEEPAATPVRVAAAHFPDGPLTIVPLALALGTVMDSATAAILLASNIGGDSDSVASIAGAVLGARIPETVDDDWYEQVEAINGHHLMALAERLAALRQ